MFVALAQLIIAIDVTVVNIALPTVQEELGLSDGARQWVVAAYTLSFGSLLLFGGRLADAIGHRTAFVAALAGFALASAMAGAAGSGELLIAARVLQGAAGAVLSPAALALVTTMFTRPEERARAFGMYSAVASSGLAAGFVVGGLVTEYFDWRWAFYVGVPCAGVAAVGVLATVPSTDHRARPAGLDLPGVLLSATGLVTLTIALAGAQEPGWAAPRTALAAGAACVLLAGFAVVETRTARPLVPPRLVTDRVRAGVYLAVFLAIAGLFGLFLLTTYYLQSVRGYPPLRTGLAFLPLILGMAVGATQIAGRLPRVAPRWLMAAGFGLALVAMVMLTRLQVDSGYLRFVLPCEVLLGVGMGLVFVPATNLSTVGTAADSGVASAVYVTVQQLGAAIGTVVLNGVAAAATADRAAGAAPTVADVVHGFTVAIWWAVALLAVGAAVALTLITHPPRALQPHP